MRRFLTRALGALSLGALLILGVGSTPASADSPATPATAVAGGSHVQPAATDWWL